MSTDEPRIPEVPDEPVFQSGRLRVIAQGQLHPHGSKCTCVWERVGDVWLLYPFGLTGGVVRVQVAEMRAAAQRLLDGST